MTPTEGLRERKKRQTRETIIKAALDLFASKGFAATTLPEIAEAADVSPRTISTYFQAKEDLVFPDTAEMFDRLEARLNSRSESETTAEALRAWFADESPRLLAERSALARSVVRSSEHLQSHAQRYMIRGENMLAASIARDLSADPDGLEARIASAATLAIFSVLRMNKDDATSQDDALELLDGALTFVDGGIRALQNTSPAEADDYGRKPAATSSA
ncbi:MAG TPA: helix-turn-helix domain-containing protein [Solirubrobacteraceae bacterium]|nr:helix-turn-helix domain-containing protein [Solirubrobacteraceae bacterium]